MSGDREEWVKVTLKVRASTNRMLDEFLIETYGKKRGEKGRTVDRFIREGLDRDRYARIEEEVERLNRTIENEVLPRLPDEDLHTHARHFGEFEDLPKQTRKGVQGLLDNLEEGEVYPSDIKQAAMSAPASVGDGRTITKYREILERRGILLPHPVKTTDLSDPEAWMYPERKFATMCESHSEVTTERLDALLGELEAKGWFSTKAYRDALPDDFPTPLKVDQFRAGGVADREEGET